MFGNTLGVLGGHTKHLSAPHTSFLPLDPDFHGFTPLQNGTWTGEAECPLYIQAVGIQGAWGAWGRQGEAEAETGDPKIGEKIDFFDFFQSIQKVFGNTLGVLGGDNKHLSAPHTPFLPLDPYFHGFIPLQNGTCTGEAQCPLCIPVSYTHLTLPTNREV